MLNEPVLDEMPVRDNSIFIIEPYRVGVGWAFDDLSVGLLREAFVAGADLLLNVVSEGRDKVTVVFASIPFKGYTIKLDYVSGNAATGTDYIWGEEKLDLWLCPAIQKYFRESPTTLYLQIK